MDKLKLQTPNVVDENILKIEELFPNCVVESKDDEGNIKKSIDFDLLKQELSDSIVDGMKERYQLNWPGKKEALWTANTPIEKTLRPCREESVDFDKTQNLFIEGDNLDVLKLLQETYLGKVKMIYIDPPYNTGNDFIYKDNFRGDVRCELEKSGQIDDVGNRLVTNTQSNGRFHSDWLSMMYPRLKLARNLLRDDGVIFISIDDNEVDNLRKLCDEIFGERNFVANIIWQKKFSPQNDAKWLSDNHDFILCHTKDKELWRPYLLPRTDKTNKRYENPDNDPRGLWMSSDFSRKAVMQNTIYPIKLPSGRIISPPEGRSWLKPKDQFKKLVADNRIYFGPDGDNVPRVKRFLSDVKQGITPLTIWLHEEVGHNQSATQELKKIGISEFQSPKPTSLLKKIFFIGAPNDGIILDFFAGSGTTAHAVMELNKEDGGNRKYIMVQLPELCDEKSEAFKEGLKTIADIGKKRIRLAGKKIKKEIENKGKQKNLLDDYKNNADDLDIGFRVLKVDSSNMEDVYYRPDEVIQQKIEGIADNIKPDRTTEDLLFQVLLSWGVDLSLPITKEKLSGIDVFFIDDNALAACFVKDGKVTEELCREIAKRKPLRVVFRDSGFENDSVKINVEQIFKLESPSTDIKTI